MTTDSHISLADRIRPFIDGIDGESDDAIAALDELIEQLQHSVEDVASLTSRNVKLVEQLQSAETTLAHAEAFIEHQDMSYRWAEWCEGRNPASRSSE